MQFVQHMFFIFIDKKHDTCQLNIKIWTLNLAKNIFLKITSVMDFFTYSTLSGPLRVTAQRDLRTFFAERVTFILLSFFFSSRKPYPAIQSNPIQPHVSKPSLSLTQSTQLKLSTCIPQHIGVENLIVCGKTLGGALQSTELEYLCRYFMQVLYTE